MQFKLIDLLRAVATTLGKSSTSCRCGVSRLLLATLFLSSVAKDESVMINNFDAAHRLLNHGAKNLNERYPRFRDKLDLFFIDHEWVPLLI